MLNVGKLYQIKQHFWYIYPSWYIATAIGHVARRWCPTATGPWATDAAMLAAADSTFWSMQYTCNITYISPNSIFCLVEVEQDKKYLKVITTNGEIGWMRYEEKDWAKGCIEEVKE